MTDDLTGLLDDAAYNGDVARDRGHGQSFIQPEI